MPLRHLTPRLRRILVPWLVTIVSGVLILGFLPLTWWIGCVFSAFRVWFYKGRWLDWADRDAVFPGSGPFPDWADALFPLVALVVLVGTSIGLMNRWLPKRWWLWTAVAAFVLLWAGSLGLLIFDPGGVLDWAIH